jgi:hypothetical protein
MVEERRSVLELRRDGLVDELKMLPATPDEWDPVEAITAVTQYWDQMNELMHIEGLVQTQTALLDCLLEVLETEKTEFNRLINLGPYECPSCQALYDALNLYEIKKPYGIRIKQRNAQIERARNEIERLKNEWQKLSRATRNHETNFIQNTIVQAVSYGSRVRIHKQIAELNREITALNHDEIFSPVSA